VNDVINGEIVAALEQWQGAGLILVSLFVGYVLQRLRRARDSNASTSPSGGRPAMSQATSRQPELTVSGA
jgi:hypothetical protein